ncbi:type II secretion system protein N [Marinicella meishanensis]|uniref:type II secretion system protein N n=1 Tax=Marinicella meishanensis TaxID=2873263 RepID=UPI001CBAF9BF
MASILALWLQFMLFPKHRDQDIQAVTAPPTNLPSLTPRPLPSSYHLFGSSTESELPMALLSGETSLNLIVTGLFASDDPQQGRAYIRSQGEEKKFQVGDDVFGMAELEAIHTDHVVLKRSGNRKETLSLSKGRTSIDTNPTQVKSPINNSTVASQRISNHINQSSNWQEMLNQQKYDPNKIAQMASQVSVIRDGQGQIAGLRVSQLSGGNALLKQGLRANDQIVAVNGVDISYQNILTLQKQLESSEEVSVTVMRNGRRMNLNLNLSELQQ